MDTPRWCVERGDGWCTSVVVWNQHAVCEDAPRLCALFFLSLRQPCAVPQVATSGLVRVNRHLTPGGRGALLTGTRSFQGCPRSRSAGGGEWSVIALPGVATGRFVVPRKIQTFNLTNSACSESHLSGQSQRAGHATNTSRLNAIHPKQFVSPVILLLSHNNCGGRGLCHPLVSVVRTVSRVALRSCRRLCRNGTRLSTAEQDSSAGALDDAENSIV